jgi:hypothetical protein
MRPSNTRIEIGDDNTLPREPLRPNRGSIDVINTPLDRIRSNIVQLDSESADFRPLDPSLWLI